MNEQPNPPKTTYPGQEIVGFIVLVGIIAFLFYFASTLFQTADSAREVASALDEYSTTTRSTKASRAECLNAIENAVNITENGSIYDAQRATIEMQRICD